MSLEVSGKVINDRALSNLVAAYAKAVNRDIDEVTREQAGELRDDIIEGTPVDKYKLRNGWQGPIKIGHAQYHVRNELPYAIVVERGGYPGVGPKTERVGAQMLPGGIEVNAGIYPTQRPAGMVRQAMSKRIVSLTKRLNEVLKQA